MLHEAELLYKAGRINELNRCVKNILPSDAEADQLPRNCLDEPLPKSDMDVTPRGLILTPRVPAAATAVTLTPPPDAQQAPDPADLPMWNPRGGVSSGSSGYTIAASATDSDPGLEQSNKRTRP